MDYVCEAGFIFLWQMRPSTDEERRSQVQAFLKQGKRKGGLMAGSRPLESRAVEHAQVEIRVGRQANLAVRSVPCRTAWRVESKKSLAAATASDVLAVTAPTTAAGKRLLRFLC